MHFFSIYIGSKYFRNVFIKVTHVCHDLLWTYVAMLTNSIIEFHSKLKKIKVCSTATFVQYSLRVKLYDENWHSKFDSTLHFNFPPSHPKCRQNEYFSSCVIVNCVLFIFSFLLYIVMIFFFLL